MAGLDREELAREREASRKRMRTAENLERIKKQRTPLRPIQQYRGVVWDSKTGMVMQHPEQD